MEKEKSDGKIGIIITILFTGFLTGVFFGIAFRFGKDIELDSILTNTLGVFCSDIKGFLSDTTKSTCGINFKLLTMILGALGLIEILITASKLKNWFLGLIIFGIGWLIGFLIYMFF